ncbi:hypothetical protein JVT61DRAFT_3926 [Boletus reticuloceps]|uniref:Uncharacterized protein n=1 Tax=Boletus reticuloceps TaxID=495285 RepID=A0A8I3A7D7_9AGAM|nr:hypothetical protein JVT61DRAFT_3926 [Boletus reticuloceps]
MAPLPSIYYPDCIAANQEARADNVLPGADKEAHLEYICDDIQRFKPENSLGCVVVFWTANTGHYSDIVPGVNDTADNLVAAIEVSPSTLFVVASILEGEPFVALVATTSSPGRPSSSLRRVQEQGDQQEQRRRRHG